MRARGPNGESIVIDDFRDAYWWLRDKTPQDARVMSWWPHTSLLFDAAFLLVWHSPSNPLLLVCFFENSLLLVVLLRCDRFHSAD
jgi:hypothetical protein